MQQGFFVLFLFCGSLCVSPKWCRLLLLLFNLLCRYRVLLADAALGFLSHTNKEIFKVDQIFAVAPEADVAVAAVAAADLVADEV